MGLFNKSIIISLFCNLFHFYAFSVYAFSAVVLSPIFFPAENIQLTKILGLTTFSMTLLLRPLGSIIFGHIGDRYGRKTALSYSLIAITFATACIGLIPSYATIGWLSSLLLILCLIVQGLCTGGQYTGAIIFIQEHSKKNRAAYACATMIAIGVFGTFLGTATSLVFDRITGLGWEWRVPFLLTFVMGMFLHYFMHHMKESPEFLENKNLHPPKKVPFMDILKNHKKVLCSAIFISSIPVSMFYFASMYIPNFYIDQNTDSYTFNPLGLTCIVQILCVILIPLFGLTAEKLGNELQLKITSFLLIITPVFIFFYMTQLSTLGGSLFGIILFSCFAAFYSGPAPAYLSEKFPVIGRYSGMGVGISIGEGIFGGFTQIVCVALQESFNSKIAPAYFIMFLGALSFGGILLSNTKAPFFNKGRRPKFLSSEDAIQKT